jgi:DMSO/TMAO reductase YedYZ molybdopterin-dependent catalytic subunit
MEAMKKNLVSIFCAAAVCAASIFATSCPKSQAEDLSGVEVKEYQGEKLSPIENFNENSIKGPQQVDKNTYRMKLTGLVKEQKIFTYDELLSSLKPYKKVVILFCVEGWAVKILWEGFLVKDLLDTAGIQPNGKYVIFHAYDGYTTMLPLAYIIEKNILIAYKMNDVTLPAARGFPFELVAEDKLGYKWIRWITEIELSDNANYRGYWESRGFTQEADIHEDLFHE